MASSGETSDLIMKFVEEGSPTGAGSAIPAESTTELLGAGATASRLLAGFEKGRIFEVRNFTFSAGLLGDESGKSDNKEGSSTRRSNDDNKAQDSNGKNKQGQRAVPQRGMFAGWRAGAARTYLTDLRPVTFTRAIDSASARLMQNCIDGKSYSSASLVKRKAAGTKAAGEVYLRLDFVGVLMTEMSWTNDDEVEEQCEFICRSVTISYRPQLPDGTLGAIVPGFWSMVPGEKPVRL
jgi:type VI protein secretion system component Hcp